MKKDILCLFLIIIFIYSMGCKKEENNQVQLERINISVEEKQYFIDDVINIYCKIYPNNTTNGKIIWVSSDENIATVSNEGVISCLNRGTVTIFATVENTDIKSSVTINILWKKPENISIKIEDKLIFIDDVIAAKVIVSPGEAYVKKIIWTSSDNNIAYVSNEGVINCLNKGEVNITATIEGTQISDTVKLTIDEPILTVDVREDLFYTYNDLNRMNFDVKLIKGINEINIIDFEISNYDKHKEGIQKIKFSYDKYFTEIEINLIEKKLLEVMDYSKVTIKNIFNTDKVLEIEGVTYGASRTANKIIAFDQKTFVHTNIYGYEIGISEYGEVISSDVNVSVPENGLVISGHGTMSLILKEIKIGDFVYYNEYTQKAIIYRKENISKLNSVYMKLDNAIKYIYNIEKNEMYNTKIDDLNMVIELCNKLLIQYDDVKKEEALSILNNFISIRETSHVHEYSYIESIEYSKMELFTPMTFSLSSKWTEGYDIGVWREKDKLVYYDENKNFRRNDLGYEVGICKDGFVVSKGILVDIPEDGYVLSGHGKAGNFIYENIYLGDRIELIDGEVIIYRDEYSCLINKTINKYDEIATLINDDMNNLIPHDYQYINSLLKRINSMFSEINQFKQVEYSLYNIRLLHDYTNRIDELLNKISYQLSSNDTTITKGVWYYPFRSDAKYQDDTTLDGVIKTLANLKEMGINEILVSLFYQKKALYDSSIYNSHPLLESCDYGSYGHDYYKCLITEAHKVGICVTAFTATFAENISQLKEKHEEWYQVDYNGERSKGSIYYYDICNDELQKMLLRWYEEILTMYDFDKIEYDIIRYSYSNLYNYENVEKIDPSKITDPGYTDYSMKKFMNQYCLNGSLKELIASSSEIRKKWIQYKEDELIKFITNCSTLLRKIKPNIVISAAALSNYENAKKGFLQDCMKWKQLGILDEIEAMNYTISLDKFTSVFEKIDKNMNMPADIGIMCYDKSCDLSIEAREMRIAKNGFVMYNSYGYLQKDEFVENMKSNHHIESTCSFSKPQEIEQSIRNNIIDMVNGYYQYYGDYNDLVDALKTKDLKTVEDIIKQIDDNKVKTYLLELLVK